MQLAARWLGVGSVVVGTLGAIALAVSLYPPAPEKLTYEDGHWREYTYAEFTLGDQRDVDAAQACLDRYSGWIEIDRDQRGRATSVAVDDEATALVRCMRDASDRGRFLTSSLYRRPGPWAFFHERVTDTWAGPKDVLVSHVADWKPWRCPSELRRLDANRAFKRRDILTPELQRMLKDAPADLTCPGAGGFVDVELTVADDGRIREVWLDSSDTEAAFCVSRQICRKPAMRGLWGYERFPTVHFPR